MSIVINKNEKKITNKRILRGLNWHPLINLFLSRQANGSLLINVKIMNK